MSSKVEAEIGRKKIPLLITMDLEVASDHDAVEQLDILARLAEDLKKIGARITIFVVGIHAKHFRQQLQHLQAQGHEIGCHGLTHKQDDNYSKLGEAEQRSRIEMATRLIGDTMGRPPVCFRGPGMTTSSITQKMLLENHYRADFSVCSQRFDIANSAGGQAGWLIAPRQPYHPAADSPFRRGALPLHVVPMLCYGLPFLSGSLYISGLGSMKFLFRRLLNESQKKQKPIVYLFHSYEFCAFRNISKQKRLHRIYRQDRKWRYQQNLALLTYMLSDPQVTSQTGQEFLDGELSIAKEGGSTCTN